MVAGAQSQDELSAGSAQTNTSPRQEQFPEKIEVGAVFCSL
jgi:hypothetical protein